MKEIGARAFSGCTNLKDLVIGESVVTIGELAFSECSSLKTVCIPGSVKEIRSMAFNECRHLAGILIPASVKKLGRNTFLKLYRVVESLDHGSRPGPQWGFHWLPGAQKGGPGSPEHYN